MDEYREALIREQARGAAMADTIGTFIELSSTPGHICRICASDVRMPVGGGHYSWCPMHLLHIALDRDRELNNTPPGGSADGDDGTAFGTWLTSAIGGAGAGSVTGVCTSAEDGGGSDRQQ